MRASLRNSILILPLLAACNSHTNVSQDMAVPADPGFSAPLFIVGEPDPTIKPIEVHSLATSDGKNVYVAYSTSAGGTSGNLAVYVTAFDAYGARVFAPVKVTVGDGNETDTAIAVRGDTVLIAWSASTDQAHVRWRSLSTDGTKLGAVHNSNELLQGGVALSASQLNPWLCSTSTGFFLGGDWGLADVMSFQAAGVRLTATGDVEGEVIAFGKSATETQGGVRLAGVGAAVRATWLSVPDQGAAHGKFAELPGAATDVGAAVTIASDGNFIVFDDGKGKVHARIWGAPVDLASWSNFGSLPSVVGDEAGGAVVLGVKGSTSAKGSLHGIHMSANGATVDDFSVDTNGAGINSQSAYDVQLIRVSGKKFFVAYQEPGANKGWVAKGTFLNVP